MKSFISDEASALRNNSATTSLRDIFLTGSGISSREGFESLKDHLKSYCQQAPQNPRPFLPELKLVDVPATGGDPDKSDWILPIGAHGDKKDVKLKSVSRPAGYPEAWKTPATSVMDGKCGITCVSNMLRWYGVEKNPKDIDLAEYRSWGPGLRSDKFASNMQSLSGKTFSSKTIEGGTDALETLRGHLKDGKPVALQYMCGSTSAHWVVVASVSDEKNNPELVLQSWGGYYKVKWNEIDNAWKRGYGGPYPYVVGDEAAPPRGK